MCDKCLDIDYPVADVWRPCYVPKPRSVVMRERVYTPGEDDFQADTIIWALRKQLKEAQQVNRRLVAEREATRSKFPPSEEPPTFHAVIVNE